MPPKVRARSVKALLKITKTEKDKKDKRSCFKRNKDQDLTPSELSATALTPELENASNEGWNFIKTVAFPSIPAVLQDFWVYLELFITVVAFCLGTSQQFPIEQNFLFQYSHFALTSLALILALIDAYIYFVEIGSCARAIRYYKSKVSKSTEKEEEDDNPQFKTKTCFTVQTKEKFLMFFEIGRNVVTELILYPILILDLFSFETEQTYNPSDALGRLDYGLFIIGSFYLILAVYIMRSVVVIGSMVSLIRLPTNSKSASSSILVKFCFHACGQIAVHLIIVLVIGAKINTEISMNMTTSANVSDDSDPIIMASPFLWMSIVLGWLLPLAGTTAFFIVNYYWLREFSIDFWINMVSLLQGASFAESVFGGEGEGISETKEKTLEFVEESGYATVKQHLVKFKSPHWSTKFFYPAKIPVAAMCGVVYDICLIAFIVSLILTYEDGTVKSVVLQGDDTYTIIFFISVIVILLANLHILFLLNSLLILLVLALAIVSFFAVFVILPVLLFIYLPVVGLLGYSLLVKHLFTSNKKNIEAVDEDLQDESLGYELKDYA